MAKRHLQEIVSTNIEIALHPELIILIMTKMDMPDFLQCSFISKMFGSLVKNAATLMGKLTFSYLEKCRPCGSLNWFHCCALNNTRCGDKSRCILRNKESYMPRSFDATQFKIGVNSCGDICLQIMSPICPNYGSSHTIECDIFRLIQSSLYYKYENNWYRANRFVDCQLSWCQ